jgi:hypothetical protein
VGCFGGMLITVDYFLTTAISEAGVKTLKAALQLFEKDKSK